MSVDTAALEIRVAAGKLDEATKKLDKFTSTSQKTERATDGLNKTFKNLVGPVAALVSVTALARKLIEVSREFDVLNAGLITATKSSENAAKAFEALQEFAAKTPYDLKQAVAGFTQLVNLGLTPSEKALISYGNTASAMGKNLDQMIGAVADAATGEFERLKEFGIKAKNEGDQVTFTFQGVKTSVKNNAAEIEKYLMALGENQFAGAMQRRMETLDGSLSNLEDNWNSLFRNVSQAGVGDLIKEQVDFANEALDELNTMLKSGEMDAYLKAMGIGWATWGKDVSDSVSFVDDFLKTTFDGWGPLAESASEGLYLGFKEFPVEIRAYFQEAAVEAIAFVDRLLAQAVYAKDAIATAFDSDTTLEDARRNYDKRVAISNQVRESLIDDISQEKDAALAGINEQILAGTELRKEYDKQLEARKKLGEDRLAQYKVGGDPNSDSGLTPGEQKKADAKAKQQKKEYDSLVASLLTEEESIQASYEKRREIIERNTTAESTARSNLMARLKKDRQEELDQLHGIESALEKRKRLVEEIREIEESTWTDNQRLAAAYQTQMESLWQAQQAGLLNEQQHSEAVKKITLEYEKQQDASEKSFLSMEEFGKQAARNVQDEFADFLFDPFSEGLDGMLLGFIKVVQRMAAEAAAAQLGAALFGSSGGGEGGGWLGSLISWGGAIAGSYFGGGGATGAATAGGAAQGASNFGSQFDASMGNVSFPGRASGGSTVGGQMYEVTERGPELYESNGRQFLLDNQAGNVTPLSPSNASGGSGVSLSMVFNIDNSGNTTGGSATSEDGNRFGQVMKTIALKTIQEEQQPGGSLWNQEANRNG